VKPFARVTPTSLGFGLKPSSCIYTGATVFESISVANVGIQDLHISQVTLSGDPAFGVRLENQANGAPASSVLPFIVKGFSDTVVKVTFSPLEEQAYFGRLEIVSDATNLPDLSIPLTGAGWRRPDAGSPDGG
jgi:hypothetical protein